MAYIYETFGEFTLPRSESKSRIDDNLLKNEFWPYVERSHPKLTTASGCYILAIRHGTGIKPWYVGKANGKKGFLQEVTNDRNVRNFNAQIDRQKSGTPVLFLIARMTPGGRFKNNQQEQDLAWLEKELIKLSLNANAELINKQKTDFAQKLVLPGVFNTPRQRHSEPTQKLRRCLNLYSVRRVTDASDDEAALKEMVEEIQHTIEEIEDDRKSNPVDGISADIGLPGRTENLVAEAETNGEPSNAAETNTEKAESEKQVLPAKKKRFGIF